MKDFINSIICGNVIDVLKDINENSFHSIITSPPYYRLRDYGVKGQIGLEESVEDYIDSLVSVFSECKRVLREDGIFFLNIADTYAGSGRAGNNKEYWDRHSVFGKKGNKKTFGLPTKTKGYYKVKDQMLIPHRLLIELQKDGWYVRSTIIWEKKSCRPESVVDRYTNNFEYIFMMSKMPRYYFDRYSLREKTGAYYTGGNPRVVWSMPTGSYSNAHFAVFPEELVYRLLKSSTSDYGCCSNCLNQYERIVRNYEENEHEGEEKSVDEHGECNGGGIEENYKQEDASGSKARGSIIEKMEYDDGWKKMCDCKSEKITPPIVLDPFIGSGTTGLVSKRMNRDFVGIELNPDYSENAKNRINNDRPLFNSVRVLNYPGDLK